ncbi:MAG: RNA polymerase sigma factor [Flavobacterium sp.]|nr:RNA polymerase sigma factor [Flavobacterium sp.]
MDHSSFNQLIDSFKGRLYRLAKRLLVSHEEAQDAVQEIVAKLWVKHEILPEYKSVEALAMTMTKNYCLDQLKSKRASNLKIVHSDYTDKSEDLQQNIENADSLRWVERILDSLPTQQRTIVQLRDIEQYDFDKIAEIMEMNEPAIRTALSRARKSIRESMIKTHSYGITQN